MDEEVVEFMTLCNPRGPLVMHITKLYPNHDCTRFDAFGRILSGTLRPGDRVKVLGEGFTPEDEEDSSVQEVASVSVYQARYRVPVTKATAGNLVLVQGVDATMVKTSTLVAEGYAEPVCIFRPLRFQVSGPTPSFPHFSLFRLHYRCHLTLMDLSFLIHRLRAR